MKNLENKIFLHKTLKKLIVKIPQKLLHKKDKKQVDHLNNFQIKEHKLIIYLK